MFSSSLQKNQHHTRSHSSDSKLAKPRRLNAPYIKFESKSRDYKPVLCEFQSFPKLYFNGKSGTSPFINPGNFSTKEDPNKKHRDIKQSGLR